MMSDHGHFYSYEGHKERRTGKIREAFKYVVVVVSHIQRIGCQPEKTTLHGGQCTGLWTAGCWFARRLHQLKDPTTMDLGISIFLLFARRVA